jgi:hypothetical protein
MLSVVDSDGTTAGGAKVTKGAGGAAAALSDRLFLALSMFVAAATAPR